MGRGSSPREGLWLSRPHRSAYRANRPPCGQKETGAAATAAPVFRRVIGCGYLPLGDGAEGGGEAGAGAGAGSCAGAGAGMAAGPELSVVFLVTVRLWTT